MIKATYIDHMGNDLTVANAARVSFGKTAEMEDDPWGPPKLKAKDDKLIRYLAKHQAHQSHSDIASQASTSRLRSL